MQFIIAGGFTGPIYAAISHPWLQDSLTVYTLIEKRTSNLWHGFFLGEATLRAGDIGLELYGLRDGNKFTKS